MKHLVVLKDNGCKQWEEKCKKLAHSLEAKRQTILTLEQVILALEQSLANKTQALEESERKTQRLVIDNQELWRMNGEAYANLKLELKESEQKCGKLAQTIKQQEEEIVDLNNANLVQARLNTIAERQAYANLKQALKESEQKCGKLAQTIKDQEVVNLKLCETIENLKMPVKEPEEDQEIAALQQTIANSRQTISKLKQTLAFETSTSFGLRVEREKLQQTVKNLETEFAEISNRQDSSNELALRTERDSLVQLVKGIETKLTDRTVRCHMVTGVSMEQEEIIKELKAKIGKMERQLQAQTQQLVIDNQELKESEQKCGKLAQTIKDQEVDLERWEGALEESERKTQRLVIDNRELWRMNGEVHAMFTTFRSSNIQ